MTHTRMKINVSVKPQSYIHGSSYCPPRSDLDGKTGVSSRKSSISTVCKGSIRVSYSVCKVSVWFLYEFTMVYGGITDAHNGAMVRYRACMVKLVAPQALTITFFMIMIFWDNVFGDK